MRNWQLQTTYRSELTKRPLGLAEAMCALTLGLLMALLVPIAAHAEATGADTTGATAPDLTDLSLEDLLNVKVTLVSRKAEKLNDTAAAVYVITQDEIRRSGLTSIPELLRLVPGMQAGHVGADKWSVGSRGFNEVYANKLLVLMDGRTVYNPLFSGVQWEYQETLIEDIDRIEVIRGPGAALWGANAVNGVINIVTKSAWDTQGSLAVTSFGGGEETRLSSVRYGGPLSDNARFRVYTKSTDYGSFPESPYGDVVNSRTQNRAGFRADWERSERSTVTVQGDAYEGETRDNELLGTATPPYIGGTPNTTTMWGQNMLFRWERPTVNGSGSSLQLYYDRYGGTTPNIVSYTVNTWDMDFQSQLNASERHQLIWGFGYRRVDNQVGNTENMACYPAESANHLYSAFIQDDIELRPERLKATLGSKFEHNAFTGLEIQPNLRLCYTPRESQTLWAAVSRAVRTPSWLERDVVAKFGTTAAPDGTPILVQLRGSSDYGSEDLLAYELGYRTQPTPRLSFDVSAFYNIYSNGRSLDTQALEYSSTPTPHLILPLVFDNEASYVGRGAEVLTSWQASAKWRLTATCTWLTMRTHLSPNIQDTMAMRYEHLSPRRQFSLRSYTDLSSKLEFDALLFWVSSAEPPLVTTATPNIPAYSRLDLRLGWKARKDLEVSFGVRNAMNDRHIEGGSTWGEIPAEVERSIYTKANWTF